MKFWILPIILLASMDTIANIRNTELLDCDDYKHDDYISLACNMYWEANNQGTEGMLAVAAVTLERQQNPDYPNTIAKVVWEQRRTRSGRISAQFSWTNDGKRDAPSIFGRKTWEKTLRLARMFSVPFELKSLMCPQIAATNRMWDILEARGVVVKRREIICEAYETTMRSKLALVREIAPVSGALFYHATYVKPYWSARLVKDGWKVIRVKDHIFYHKVAFNE